MTAVEIEIDGQHNECLQFRPLQRSIRGRFDMNRVGEPNAKTKGATEWPVPIPSQRLGVNPDGTGYVLEPLHDAECEALLERIKSKGMSVEPAVQEFEGIDVPTWLFWLKRAVESGLAKVVKGKLPDTIDGTPRKDFINAPPQPSNTDKLTAALEAQTAAFNKLIEALSNK